MRQTFTTLKKITVFTFLISLCVNCSSKTTEPKETKEGFKTTESSNLEAETLVNYMVNELMSLPSLPPGVSLAISKDDKISYTKGFGYTNLKTRQPVTPSTQFRMGSLSRLITITSLVKLIEKRKLNFNDTLQKLFPEYPEKEFPFTIKQLASGLSGMQHYTENDNFYQESYSNIDDALTVFSHIPLAHKPGDTYQYSTHSYTLLSKVIEKVSGRNFSTVLKEDLFYPLSMNSTSIEDLRNRPEQMTDLFELNNETINKSYLTQIDTLKDYSYSWAGVGMISTPSDLLKLGNSYMNDFIKEEELTTVFEIQKLNSGDTIRQSIGWDKNWDMDNRKVFEQDGFAEGTRNIISVFPEEKISISLMTNAYGIRAIEETAHTLAIPFLTKPSPQKQPKGVFELEILEDVRTQWVKRNGFVVLDGENDRLVINPDTENEEIFKLIYLNRKNKYALIHPDGILYSEINLNNNTITGKVMYYRGPNLHKTSTEPPYLKFKSLSPVN